MEITYEQIREKYVKELKKDLALWETREKEADSEKHKELCGLWVYYLSSLLEGYQK